jgi:predicted Zn-dependent protease with MMP-like domain
MKRFEERRGQELAQLPSVLREGLTHVAIIIEDAPPDLGDGAVD